MNHLKESHTFKIGDPVIVYDRCEPNVKFNGIIHQIVYMESSKFSDVFVDYFYIRFPTNVYDTLLKRGHNIIYRGKPEVVGDIIRNDKMEIETLYIQFPFSARQTQIELEYLHSMLIWRVGFCIERP